MNDTERRKYKEYMTLPVRIRGMQLEIAKVIAEDFECVVTNIRNGHIDYTVEQIKELQSIVVEEFEKSAELEYKNWLLERAGQYFASRAWDGKVTLERSLSMMEADILEMAITPDE